MGVLVWLVIPLIAAGAAVVYTTWAARDRRAGDVAEVAGYERFREAMQRSHSSSGSA
ncbi:hypothetical protein [Streptomyces sp. NPDC057702]|uniref:hypothetical protein n=1 Tax=unclassified Streptomyces TaxID=2593676 RepID=UPI00368D9B11